MYHKNAKDSTRIYQQSLKRVTLVMMLCDSLCVVCTRDTVHMHVCGTAVNRTTIDFNCMLNTCIHITFHTCTLWQVLILQLNACRRLIYCMHDYIIKGSKNSLPSRHTLDTLSPSLHLATFWCGTAFMVSTFASASKVCLEGSECWQGCYTVTEHLLVPGLFDQFVFPCCYQ